MLIIMLNFMLENVLIQPYVCLKHDIANIKSVLFYQRPNKLNK